MKQYVSVIKDGFVTYYIADGEKLDEYARIRVRESFAAVEAVALGLNVAEAVGLNGFSPTGPVANGPGILATRPIAALPPAPEMEKMRRRKPPTQVSSDAVLAYLRSHPATTSGEAARFFGVPAKTVSNRLWYLERNHGTVVGERKVGEPVRWSAVV